MALASKNSVAVNYGCSRSRLEIGNWKFGRPVCVCLCVACLRAGAHRQRDETSYIGRILCANGVAWHKSNEIEYKAAIVEKLGPKLNAFINSTKA